MEMELTKGLNEKDYSFRLSTVKGRIAETLVEELFISSGFNVFRYGMENTIPGVMKLLKGVKSEVADDIKRMPDFVIQSNKTRGVFFVEVKFRANGKFSRKDLPINYPYENVYFILISKKHIKCITFEELERGGVITPESKNYLGYRKEFDLDKEVIKDFCQFAEMFFAEV